MYKIISTLLVCAGLTAIAGPAIAQNEPSNMRNFYMARQQWTITDDAPMIDDRRTNPQAAGGGGVGGMQGGPPALPKAGWQGYSSNIPSVRTALPQVNNGVPKALPQAQNMSGKMGKAGSLKPQAAPKPTGPVTVQSYKAYKGYGGSLTPTTTSGYGQSGGRSTSTSTAVQGSVLNWARKR